MLIAVAYDIPDDRRRTKLAEHLENFGQRVQLSVFECLLEEKQAERMKAGIGRLVDEEEDTVRIYRLCVSCEERVEIVGRGVRSEDPEVYIV